MCNSALIYIYIYMCVNFVHPRVETIAGNIELSIMFLQCMTLTWFDS